MMCGQTWQTKWRGIRYSFTHINIVAVLLYHTLNFLDGSNVERRTPRSASSNICALLIVNRKHSDITFTVSPLTTSDKLLGCSVEVLQ